MTNNTSKNTLMPATALVTGATRRLGAAISHALAANGWQVLLHARQPNAATEQFGAELRQTYQCQTWCIYGDFAEPGTAARLFATALAYCGRLHTLINNASLFERQPIVQATAQDYTRHWRINTLAPIELTTLLYKHVCDTDSSGVVVNLLDQRITRSDPDATPYLLSKCALADFTTNAAVGFAPRLRVNAVAPGAILAPVSDSASEPAGDFPLGFRPTAQMVAQAVLTILQSPALTGQTIFVDGGQHLR